MPEDLQWLESAFLALSSDRATGLGVGPIPWTAVDQYAARHGIEDEEFELLEAAIVAMDVVFLKHMNQKADPKGENR